MFVASEVECASVSREEISVRHEDTEEGTRTTEDSNGFPLGTQGALWSDWRTEQRSSVFACEKRSAEISEATMMFKPEVHDG